MASPKWEHFERLVAAIHQIAQQGADIRWNAKIEGRQFDVIICFEQGLYQYLTVVECKDYATPVPVEKVEAFVTKARDAQANKAVMASTSGFQQGAREVATRYNMSFIHVTESKDIDLSLFGGEWAGVKPMLQIRSVELEYTDGERKKIADDLRRLHYYAKHIRLQGEVDQIALDAFIHINQDLLTDGTLNVFRETSIPCPPCTHVIGPVDSEIPLKSLRIVHVLAGLAETPQIKSAGLFEPSLLRPPVSVKDVLTGRERVFQRHDLPLGIGTKFKEGHFYEQSPIGFYYCERIDGGLATIILVESFQLGHLMQARLAVEIKNAKHYMPVSDESVLERLRRRLEQFRASIALKTPHPENG
jgi:hypothetical protein